MQIADLGGVAVEIGVVDVQRRFVAVLVVVRFLRQIGVCRPERELPAVRFGGGEDCGQAGKQRGRAEEQEQSFAFAHRNNVLPLLDYTRIITFDCVFVNTFSKYSVPVRRGRRKTENATDG